MPIVVPHGLGGRWITEGISGNSGTAVQAGASAGTKGLWTQIVSSTDEDTFGVKVHILAGQTTFNRPVMVDIGIGAAASEEIVIPDLMGGMNKSDEHVLHYEFPLFVPAGSRIAARASGTTGSTVIDVALSLGYGSASIIPVVNRIHAYNADPSNAQASTTGSYGTSGTWGSYVQLTASADKDHHWVNFNPHCYGLGGFAGDDDAWIDIARGAASSEETIVDEMAFRSGATTDCLDPVIVKMPLTMIEGARYSARAKRAGASAQTFYPVLWAA